MITLTGWFKFKIKRDGGVIETDWVRNLVTTVGVNSLSGGVTFDWCRLGTGSTAPTPGDTDVQTQVAQSTVKSATLTDVANNSTYVFKRESFTFDAFVADISEVGIGWGTDLFSRTVFSPLEITIYDSLEVTYELRLMLPATSTIQQTIGGVPYDVTRSIDINQAVNFLDGMIAATSTATANSSAVSPSVYDVESYVLNSNAIGAYIMFNTTVAVPIADIKFGPFEISFSPQIPKNAFNVFGFDINFSWS